MRILIHSNAPWSPTGYGNQVNVFAHRLKDLGHEITISAFYGLNGSIVADNGIKVLPGSKDAYGNDMLLAHKEYYGFDLTLTLIDIWVLNPDMLRMLDNAWAWAPVDHDPIPPPVVNHLKACRGAIAYSKFGHKQMLNAGLSALYVPHGVDTNAFYPMDRAEARLAINAPKDVFLAGMVMANKGAPSRKAFDQQIRAFAAFHRNHPDTMLYLHTDMKGIQGEDLNRIIELSGLEKQAVGICPQYEYLNGMLHTGHMRAVYSACNVIMNATRGEGFGIPILEAQACGTPVIVTDFSAMPELCFAGWKVGYVDKVYTPQGSYQVIPSVKDIERSLEKAYRGWKSGRDVYLRDKARAGAMEYDADRVTQEYWKPALQEIERRMTRKPVVVVTPVHPKSIQADGVVMKITENVDGGTAEDAADEVVNNYGLDKLDLQPGDVVLDFGANVGIPAIYLAKKYPGVKIYAYEPVHETFQHLLDNIERNGVGDSITAIQKAVTGDARDVVLMGNTSDNAGGMSLYGGIMSERQAVKSVTLREAMADHERIALLKMDIEGAEYEAIGDGSLLERVGRFRGEIHTNPTLRRRGYEVETLKRTILDKVPDSRIDILFMRDWKPTVSLIIPTLNGAGTIGRAIDAALAQSVSMEIIVVDDGSTDNTQDVLKTYGDKITVITQDGNQGQVPAMNAGLARATGRYILFHGDDDWLEYPNGVLPLVQVLDNAPNEIAFAYGHLQYHGRRNDIMMAKPYHRQDYETHFPAGTGVIWRAALRDGHKLQYRALHDGKTGHCEDFDMILQIIKAGYVGQAVNALVIHYTLAGDRATSWVHANQNTLLPLWRERHPEFKGQL